MREDVLHLLIRSWQDCSSVLRYNLALGGSQALGEGSYVPLLHLFGFGKEGTHTFVGFSHGNES